jgi:hypothetical protein
MQSIGLRRPRPSAKLILRTFLIALPRWHCRHPALSRRAAARPDLPK